MGADGDAITHRSGVNRIHWFVKVKIEPWLLWVWNEQTFFFESTNYTLDDASANSSGRSV